MPSLRSPQGRIGSPEPGGSTLITSAPNSPNAVPTMGPAARVAASTTRSPCKGRCAPALSGMELGGGPAQTEVVAQRRPGVPLTEHAPALQLGHDQPHHVLVGAGRVG